MLWNRYTKYIGGIGARQKIILKKPPSLGTGGFKQWAL